MQVVPVIGFLGSGKSTFIKRLLAEVDLRGAKGGVVVNDQGEVSLESELAGRYPVEAIGGG